MTSPRSLIRTLSLTDPRNRGRKRLAAIVGSPVVTCSTLIAGLSGTAVGSLAVLVQTSMLPDIAQVGLGVAVGLLGVPSAVLGTMGLQVFGARLALKPIENELPVLLSMQFKQAQERLDAIKELVRAGADPVALEDAGVIASAIDGVLPRVKEVLDSNPTAKEHGVLSTKQCELLEEIEAEVQLQIEALEVVETAATRYLETLRSAEEELTKLCARELRERIEAGDLPVALSPQSTAGLSGRTELVAEALSELRREDRARQRG